MSVFLKAAKGSRSNPPKVALLAIDMFFLCVSIAAAYIIRSRFVYFIFSDLYLLYCLPYVFLFRFLNNFLFDLYSLDLSLITLRDILKVYLINLIPSGLFVLIRFLSPLEFLRIPVSIIFAEYFFTVLFISLSRILINANLKKQKLKNPGWQHSKPSLLLLNLQFSAEHLSDGWGKNDVTAIGILTQNQLLWDSEFKNTRVIGGLHLLKDLILTHNRDLWVVIDEALGPELKYAAYRESVNSGAACLMLSRGRLRYPVLTDLLARDDAIGDHLPHEIESWLKGRELILLGSEMARFSELTDYLTRAGAGCEARAFFSRENIPVTPRSVVIDLRLCVAHEKGLALDAVIRPFADSLDRLLKDVPTPAGYLLVVPRRVVSPPLEELLRGKNLTSLILNDILPDNDRLLRDFTAAPSFDPWAEALAAVFKALFDGEKSGRRRYRFHSLNAVDPRTLISDPCLRWLLPAAAGQLWAAPTDGAEELSGEPTVYSGLYVCDQKGAR